MNKQRLIELIQNGNYNQEDLSALSTLSENHPYSQVLHTLVAQATHKLKRNNAQQALHTAAMYATERNVLKRIIGANQAPTQSAQSPATTSDKKKTFVPRHPSDGDKVRKELMDDLATLSQLMKSFEEDFGDDAPTAKAPAKAKKVAPAKKTKESTKAKKAAPKEKPLKSKLVEQVQLIDDFIKKEPSIKSKISKNIDDSKEQIDLSSTSVDFGEELISENLANILIKQGKKSKAIDIYKKLIWKFPQKKAYFASQIEALKK